MASTQASRKERRGSPHFWFPERMKIQELYSLNKQTLLQNVHPSSIYFFLPGIPICISKTKAPLLLPVDPKLEKTNMLNRKQKREMLSLDAKSTSSEL
jgi:hypothetical protein